MKTSEVSYAEAIKEAMRPAQSRRQRRRKTQRAFNNSGRQAVVTVRTTLFKVEKYKQVLQRIGNKTIVHWI